VQESGAVRLDLVALSALCGLALTATPARAYEIEDFKCAVYREGVQDETNYADEAGEHPHVLRVIAKGAGGRSAKTTSFKRCGAPVLPRFVG
jgi:hypothetical protein